MSSRLHGWRGGLLLAACATVLTLSLLGAAGEWAVRRRERTRATPPGTTSKLFYRHTRLIHALERGTDYYGWVHIGQEGFRGARSVASSPPDSVFRIIAVGGSTTFDGNTSGDTSAWPARLEQILNTVAPGRYEVLNAGVPGYQLLDDLVRLEFELHRYQPDLIILFQGHNDLFNALSHAGDAGEPAFQRRPGEVPTVYPWVHWLERNSLLYHKLRSRFQAIRFRSTAASGRVEIPPERFRAAVDEGADNFARGVRLYLAVAQALRIPVVIPQVVYARGIGVPQVDSAARALWSTSSAPIEIVWEGYARYDSVARAVAQEFGASYIPASDPELWKLDGFAAGDPIHFNDRGSYRLAEHLARAIGAQAGDHP